MYLCPLVNLKCGQLELEVPQVASLTRSVLLSIVVWQVCGFRLGRQRLLPQLLWLGLLMVVRKPCSNGHHRDHLTVDGGGEQSTRSLHQYGCHDFDFLFKFVLAIMGFVGYPSSIPRVSKLATGRVRVADLRRQP